MNSNFLTAFCISSLCIQIPVFGEEISILGPMIFPIQGGRASAKSGAWVSNAVSICFPHGAPTPADMDFGSYLSYVQSKIKHVWLPARGLRTQKLALGVVLEISRGGDVTHLRIGKSCGVVAADKSILQAIKNMGTLKPLPSGAPQSIEVQFNFDYQNPERNKRR